MSKPGIWYDESIFSASKEIVLTVMASEFAHELFENDTDSVSDFFVKIYNSLVYIKN
jgi:hypothetical protein